MKKSIISFVIVHSFLSVSSQQKTYSVAAVDSIPVVQLAEVKVKGLFKNTNQHLVHYYVANKSATTEDILSRLPELNMIRRGSYGMEPLIRSYTTGEIGLLIDGMRIHGACTDKMDPASIYIEPQNLQSIQVQTNHGFQTGSVIGGSINLKLVEPEFDTGNSLSGSVSSGYQSAANAFYETGYLNYAKNKLAIRANISYRKAQEYRSGGGAIIPYSQYEKINYGVSAKYNINPKWMLKSDILFDDGWNIGYPALPMDVGYACARIVSLSILNTDGKGRWKNTEMKIYANSIRHIMDDTHRKNIVMHMDMPGESSTYGAYIASKLLFPKYSNIEFRADVSSTFLKASMTMYQPNQPVMYMLTWPDNRSLQTGMAATFTHQIDSASFIIASTRVDEFANSLTSQMGKDQLSVFNRPVKNINRFLKNVSAEYNHKFSSQFKTKLSLSYSERMATSTELYGFYLFNAYDGYDYIGNTILKPENALKAEANISCNYSSFRFSLTGFVSKIHNYIMGMYQPGLSTMTVGANGVKVYQNLPSALLAGMEASIISQPYSSVYLINTTKFNYGQDNNKNPLPLMAPLKNITSVRKQIKQFSIQAETEFSMTQNRINIYAKESPAKGYMVANLRFMYEGLIKKNWYRIDTGIDNVFDNAYKEHLDWGNINRPGRNVYVQFSYAF